MKYTAKDVLLFVPNLIGYARIILLVVSLFYMRTDHGIAASLYLLSGLLDALDGHAARILNQCSKFGAMLDQLTDRAATACLVVTLAFFYPDYAVLFQLSLTLDIVSHWLHLHASLMKGTSHKSMGLDSNPVMKLYYTSRPFLFFMCAGNEVFFSMLYLLNFTEGPILPIIGVHAFRLLMQLTAPIMVGKTIISFIHLMDASYRIVAVDAEEKSSASMKSS